MVRYYRKLFTFWSPPSAAEGLERNLEMMSNPLSGYCRQRKEKSREPASGLLQTNTSKNRGTPVQKRPPTCREHPFSVFACPIVIFRRNRSFVSSTEKEENRLFNQQAQIGSLVCIQHCSECQEWWRTGDKVWLPWS